MVRTSRSVPAAGDQHGGAGRRGEEVVGLVLHVVTEGGAGHRAEDVGQVHVRIGAAAGTRRRLAALGDGAVVRARVRGAAAAAAAFLGRGGQHPRGAGVYSQIEVWRERGLLLADTVCSVCGSGNGGSGG